LESNGNEVNPGSFGLRNPSALARCRSRFWRLTVAMHAFTPGFRIPSKFNFNIVISYTGISKKTHPTATNAYEEMYLLLADIHDTPVRLCTKK